MSSSIFLAQVPPPTSTTTNAPAEWNWAELAKLRFEKGELVLSFGPVMLAALLLGCIIFLVWRRHRFTDKLRHYEVVKYTLKAANIGEVEVVPNNENIRIAYQAWIELTTRKVALPFDEENDVIVEIYDSYYQAFGRLRDLAKSIPAHRLRECKDLRELVAIMIKVLNHGLRPHLTVWQAKFRRWYANELADDAKKGLTPQEIQKRYPQYAALVADLRKVHENSVDYAEFLCRVAQGESAPGKPSSP